jgi:predicted O-methyltransferase YrrM
MDKLKKYIIPLLNKLPYIKTLNRLLKQYETEMAYPPGHYYSPVPDWSEVAEEQEQIFAARTPLAVDLHEERQLQLLEAFVPYYKDFPFREKSVSGFRFAIPESFLTYTDALVLYAFVRHFRPSRIIEIGSGYSSAMLLDINQHYFENRIQLTFVDPDFIRLRKLMKTGDEACCTLLEQKVQKADKAIFQTLQENDLLFIDSSHVGKAGSDLNYLLFEILPALPKGVIIHFHDIYYPFEYTKEMLLTEKLAWNEAYLLRAFLMYNTSFEIMYFNNMLYRRYPEILGQKMPDSMKDEGASLYIKKIS